MIAAGAIPSECSIAAAGCVCVCADDFCVLTGPWFSMRITKLGWRWEVGSANFGVCVFSCVMCVSLSKMLVYLSAHFSRVGFETPAKPLTFFSSHGRIINPFSGARERDINTHTLRIHMYVCIDATCFNDFLHSFFHQKTFIVEFFFDGPAFFHELYSYSFFFCSVLLFFVVINGLSSSLF